MATNLLIQPDPAIERRRRLAEALGAGPRFQNVQHWTQGASNIAGPMLSAWLGRSADQEDAQRRQQAMEKISQAMSHAGEGGGQGDRYSALAQALSDINPELGINMQLQQMQQQQAAKQAAMAAESQRRGKLEDAKELAQFKSELPRKESEFDRYLKSLQAEKTKQQVAQGEKAAAAEAQNIQTAADLAARLRESPGFEGIYGSLQGALPSIRQSSVDAAAVRDQLVDTLSLAARGQLKGQGQITEGEQRMLANAQSILMNPRISDEAALQEVERVIAYLQEKGAQLPSAPQQRSGGGQMGRNRSPSQSISPEIDALVNKYAD